LVTTLVLSAASEGRLTAQTAPVTSDVSQVRTEGSAKRSLRPDLATLTVQFTADGMSPTDAGRNVAMLADSLRRAFRGIGIPQDSLISGSRWYWWRGRVETQVSSRWVQHPGSPTMRPTSEQVAD